MTKAERGSFGSRMGFILVSAGCAIGIGNVWKFPYVAGQNGGAVFVLFYLIFLIIMGIPVLTMELAMGRASRESAVLAYKTLEKPGSRWHLHGWVCMVGCYLLMIYYTTVSGWMLSYFFKFATGRFAGADAKEVSWIYTEMLADPLEMVIFMAVTVIIGFAVLILGVRKGLERVNKFMMTGLLLLIAVLAVRGISMEGAAEGIRFYLYPDLNRALESGIGNVISAAMSQAFFTLSIGMGAMEILGSYMSEENSLTGEAVRICALDTFVALVSGLIIFPACFTYGVKPDQGPSLIFITLPEVFINMPGGRIWGTLFFVFMTFASFSTVIAVFENLVAFLCDMSGWGRGKAILVNMLFVLVASLPCVLGFNIWSNVHLFGDRNIMDSEDFLVSNLILPGGSLIFLLFCVLKAGWGFDAYLNETNKGKGMKMPKAFLPFLKFGLPVIIAIVFVRGLI